jgi:hypothetical protein
MMAGNLPYESSRIVDLYLLIAQYPMLAAHIREEMRSELFQRGIISEERFEQEVKERAVQSQEREGLVDPLVSENSMEWEQRLAIVRDHLTDFYFAYNLPLDIILDIIHDQQNKSAVTRESPSKFQLMFNPELAPLEMVLRQAEKFEALPSEARYPINHHLQELIVVLLKSLVSDQLAFIRIAKNWFTSSDFRNILDHRIGTGKIGGKSAGLLLANKILQNTAPGIYDRITIPRSYYMGADVFYDFLGLNNVENLNQKYKSDEQIRSEYDQIKETFTHARLPENIADQLREILKDLGNIPLIVRSSSLLEDNFGTSFAGKYISCFCPNQGSLKENLRDLALAIQLVYASVYSPDALLYRRKMGLIDYDERMAILIQEVQGQSHEQYYFPSVAGVAYSYSPIAWSPRIRREEGFARLVMGLGTRAVDRVANDYPRMICLSHPQLRPEATRTAMRYYSQHFVDVIDLVKNKMVTEPVEQVLGSDYKIMRYLASVDDGDTIQPPVFLNSHIAPEQLVLTFDHLIQRSDFVSMLKEILAHLADQYQLPVDVEFAVSLAPATPKPLLTFHLLQCRPQNRGIARNTELQKVPVDIPLASQLFHTSKMAPQGHVSRVEYVVFVDPQRYHSLHNQQDMTDVARLIGQINHALEGHSYILIGPGRWGSSDMTQGVCVTYVDIFNTRALIELADRQGGFSSEPSYGTHFFQDLVESEIYPLAIYPDEKEDYLNMDFISQAENHLFAFLPKAPTEASKSIKLIHVPGVRPGETLEIVMDGQKGLGYFTESPLS